jgi:hydroxymethylpyrimidine kinase/phosphomethylpyrimidine kinase
MIGSGPGVKREKSLPIALTVAGSDSGAGAGVQADLKTFAALGVHGTTALTCVTAQNPRRVIKVEVCRAATVRDQLAAVFEELRPTAVKTGMLYSRTIIRAVAGFLRGRYLPLVVDPVMISTSGAKLLKPAAIAALSRELFPLACLITPNLHEAEALLKTRLLSVEDLRWAAKELHRRFKTAVLVKGGHLRGIRQAVDIFYDGRDELLLSAPFVRGIRTHGTGCTFSAAITAYLAKGLSLKEAVAEAKEFVTQSIAHCQVAGGHDVLNWGWGKAEIRRPKAERNPKAEARS